MSAPDARTWTILLADGDENEWTENNRGDVDMLEVDDEGNLWFVDSDDRVLGIWAAGAWLSVLLSNNP